jgi:Flp pilus assembly protein TadD
MAEAERLMAVSMSVMPLPSYNLAATYHELCEGWRAEGANERALPWCRLALYTGGDDWAGLDAASASLAAGDTTGALALLGVVIGSGSGEGMAQAWRLSGDAYTAGADPPRAVDAYRRALELGATDQWTRMGLATALMRTGDPAGACEQVAAARSLGYALDAGQAAEFKDCVAGGRL